MYSFTAGTGSTLITSADGNYNKDITGPVDIKGLNDEKILISKPGFSLTMALDEIEDIGGDAPAGTVTEVIAQLRTVFPNAGTTAKTTVQQIIDYSAILHYDLTNPANYTTAGGKLLTVVDLSGQGNNATYTGGAVDFYANGGPNNKPYASKLYPNAGLVKTSPLTIYAIVKTPTLNHGTAIYTYDTAGGGYGLSINKSGSRPYRPFLRIYTGVTPYYFDTVNGSNAQVRTDWQLIKIQLVDSTHCSIESNDEITQTIFGAPAGASISTTIAKVETLCNELIIFNDRIDAATDLEIRKLLIAKHKIVSPDKMMFAFGDSHTNHVMSGTNPGDGFGSYIQRMNDLTGFKIYNFAGNGSVVNINSYPQTITLNLTDYSLKYGKEKFKNMWVQFQYGTNDSAVLPSGTPTMTIARKKAAYKACIQSFIDAGFTKSKLIICTPPYSTGAYVLGNLASIRTMVQEIATEMGITLCDFYGAMVTAGLNCGTVTGGDNIHGDNAIHLCLYNTLVAITGT